MNHSYELLVGRSFMSDKRIFSVYVVTDVCSKYFKGRIEDLDGMERALPFRIGKQKFTEQFTEVNHEN